jgi:hypothetical protein
VVVNQLVQGRLGLRQGFQVLLSGFHLTFSHSLGRSFPGPAAGPAFELME